MEIRIIILVCLFALVRQVASQARPIPVTWSTSKFGPDGPWQAVSITVGSGQGVASVDLYPGGSFDSNILVTDFCNNTFTGCAAAAGGLYDPGDSPTADFQSIRTPAGVGSWESDQVMNLTGKAVFTLDTMKIASTSTAYIIDKAVFVSVISSNVQLPNGSYYPASLGNLALGSPNPVQTFLVTNSTGNITGQLLTGNLRDNNDIPSSSFGLHIGSVKHNQQGSLILGGYDESRVVGPVASYDTVGVGGNPQVPLIDINIGVQVGGTPFNTTDIPSLYSADGNASIPVLFNPVVPYMSLPPATCAAIAEWLPVTYDPSIGLYLWNTQDYRYRTIISSPAYLAFIFQETDSTNLTIKVPFSLLNLTLENPIVATPKQYFPCQPWQSPSTTWHLGRAFMQAAYLSINWEENKFFIAQAVGPTTGPSSIQSILPTDTTITGGDISEFQSSWQSSWTVLATNSSTSGNTTGVPAKGSDQGLSTAAKAGIGVGIVVVVLGIAALVALLLIQKRRKRRRQEADMVAIANAASAKAAQQQQHPRWNEKGNAFGEPPAHNHPYHNNFNQYRHEMAVQPPELAAPNKIHEADRREIYEAPSANFAHEIDSTEVGSSPRSATTDKTLPALPGTLVRKSERVSQGPVSAATTASHGDRSPEIVSPESPRRSPRGI